MDENEQDKNQVLLLFLKQIFAGEDEPDNPEFQECVERAYGM